MNQSDTAEGQAIVAGWRRDPFQRFEHRYWDGNIWTDQVALDGQAHTDAAVTAPNPSSDGGRPTADSTDKVTANESVSVANAEPHGSPKPDATAARRPTPEKKFSYQMPPRRPAISTRKPRRSGVARRSWTIGTMAVSAGALFPVIAWFTPWATVTQQSQSRATVGSAVASAANYGVIHVVGVGAAVLTVTGLFGWSAGYSRSTVKAIRYLIGIVVTSSVIAVLAILHDVSLAKEKYSAGTITMVVSSGMVMTALGVIISIVGLIIMPQKVQSIADTLPNVEVGSHRK